MTAKLSSLAGRLTAGLLLVAALSHCSSPTPVDISTPSPTVSIDDAGAARWEGTWEFTYTLEEIEGVADVETQFEIGSTIRRIWELTPQCPDGPCNVDILATDPDDPLAPEVESSAVFDSGVYRVTQAFRPVPEDACRAADGDIIRGAFDGTNFVEVTPTDFEIRDGDAFVTEATSTKLTSFVPTAEVAGRGGTCVTKTAHWEGTVLPGSG